MSNAKYSAAEILELYSAIVDGIDAGIPPPVDHILTVWGLMTQKMSIFYSALTEYDSLHTSLLVAAEADRNMPVTHLERMIKEQIEEKSRGLLNKYEHAKTLARQYERCIDFLSSYIDCTYKSFVNDIRSEALAAAEQSKDNETHGAEPTKPAAKPAKKSSTAGGSKKAVEESQEDADDQSDLQDGAEQGGADPQAEEGEDAPVPSEDEKPSSEGKSTFQKVMDRASESEKTS